MLVTPVPSGVIVTLPLSTEVMLKPLVAKSSDRELMRDTGYPMIQLSPETPEAIVTSKTRDVPLKLVTVPIMKFELPLMSAT